MLNASNILPALFVSVLVFLLSPAASGQAVKGSLIGAVTDSSGGAVPNAQVAITETNTGIARKVVANQSGFYSVPDILPGTYSVSFEYAGFRRLVRDNVEVLVNTTVRVDAELQPGAVNESIEVTSALPDLQTDRADTGRKIETRQIADMPLAFNRNFQGLLNLVPGVDRVVRIHSEFYNPQDALSARVNGQARQANNYQIEGVDDNFRNNRLQVLIPPIEALSTVDITTSNYEAELGRAGGAVTNVNLRSGTNNLHGSLYEFNRVSALGARNVFADSKTITVYNQFGVTAGGPIIRNKTFIFADWQGVFDRRGDLTQATVPSVASRTGDLSESPTIIYDPSTGAPTGTGRTPFPNKRIPSSRISLIANRILALVPEPQIADLNTNFQRATTRAKDSNSFDAKLDHQLSSATHLSARYGWQRPVTDEPPVFGLPGGPTVGGGPAGTSGHGVQVSQSGALNWTQIFSPSFIGDFRLGVSRYRNDARQTDFGTDASAKLGIPGVNFSDYTSGITGINIGGYSAPLVGYTLSLPWVRAETGVFLVGGVTKVRGNHTLKVGGEIRRQRDVADLPDTYGSRGSFTFSAGPTSLNGDRNTSFANSMGSFLLDQPSSTSRELRYIVPELDQTAVFSYVQDKWQVTPKLTVDLGLRHEIYLPPTPHSRGGFSNYDPSNNTLLLGGLGNVPMTTGVATDWTGVSPRLGFSWRINDKTVFRGGFGGSLITTGLEVKGYYNYPIRQYFLTTAPNTYVAAGSLASGFPAPSPVVLPQDGIIRNPADASFHYVPKDFKEGRLRSWNIALQRSLPGRFVLEAAYVGNHGSNAGTTRNINSGLVPGAGVAGQPLYKQFGIQTAVVNDYFPTDTDYHSLQVKLDRRFSHGFLLTTAYTYSKAMDYAGDNGGLFINAYPDLNRARTNDNPTHIFVQSYIYELPFGKGKRWLQSGPGRWVLGDWQVNGILTLQTGVPLSITTSATTLNAPGNSNRPNVSSKPEIFGNVGRGQLWFDISKFSAPDTATYGNTGRNILSGPGFANLDFSLFRRFPVTERWRVELRMESFNVTNTPHFSNPSTGFGSAGFGQVTTALADQRLIQFGVRIVF